MPPYARFSHQGSLTLMLLHFLGILCFILYATVPVEDAISPRIMSHVTSTMSSAADMNLESVADIRG